MPTIQIRRHSQKPPIALDVAGVSGAEAQSIPEKSEYVDFHLTKLKNSSAQDAAECHLALDIMLTTPMYWENVGGQYKIVERQVQGTEMTSSLVKQDDQPQRILQQIFDRSLY